jgi:spermidine synthase
MMTKKNLISSFIGSIKTGRKKKKVLYKTRTDFNDITVTKKGNFVTLWSPANVRQTEIDLTNPTLPRLEYAKHTYLSLGFCPNPKSILIMGLGGGALPIMFYHTCPDTSIDVVEIDPEIPIIAKKYFNFFVDSRLELFSDDAFLYIQNANKKYDIIMMDAYIGRKQHRPLTTTEFFMEIKDRLTPKGLLTANLMTKNKTHFETMKSRIESVFNQLWYIPGETSTNAVAFAAKEKISKSQLLSNIKELQVPIPNGIQLKKLVEKIVK